jgi:serine/threonine-protein kinase
MPLSTGTRLGLYEIVGALGAGGMGEVYRARDTKLGRTVAVKVLPEALASDPDRIARFEREAKVLASLNHSHIAALHGLEEDGGRHFLVMELVEGETLAERLQRGPVKVEDALKIAHQMAEALEAAHEKGIVHRDLKPANVKITPDEQVKVLDFGLARAVDPYGSGGSSGSGGQDRLTHSPTLSMMATQAGIILGTAAYMSPEQAQGLPADQRSDVFSFGSVLYEMLTGRQVFQGDTAAALLASVLVREPDSNALPPNLNPRLYELLARCLDKNPKRRWQAVGDLRAEIETIAASPRAMPVAAAPGAATRHPLWKLALAALAGALVAAALTGISVWTLKPSPAPTVTRFVLALPEGRQFTSLNRHLLAISPDGTQVVYVANQSLYLRSMSENESRTIVGNQEVGGMGFPAFSPDGRSIAFFSGPDQTLKRIAVSGGAAVTICPVDNLTGVTWVADQIVFGSLGKGVMRVPANGGKPEPIVSVASDEIAHGPQLLPGGQTVLFTLSTASSSSADRWNTAQVVVQSLKSNARKTVIEGGSEARYLTTGHIVYALGGVLFAVPFDVRRLEVTGGPVPVVEGVRRATGGAGFAQYAVSDTGSLVYIPGPVSTSAAQSDLAMADRKGGVEPLKLPAGIYQYPRISPDGKQVAYQADDANEAAVWIYALSGTVSPRRLTFGGNNRFPIWSPDGQRVAFQSDREGDAGIFWQRADGNGAAERLTKPDKGVSHVPESWSPKGDPILVGVTTGSDVTLWTLSTQDKKMARFGDIRSAFPINSAFSPDGRWIAYSSSDTGQVVEIYVQPFPGTGAKYQVSRSQRSHHPFWSRDGKELLYVPGPGAPFSVVTVATQPSFTFGTPGEAPKSGLGEGGPAARRNFDITPDGKIVGVIIAGQTRSGAPAAQQIHVVLNWFEELKARIPAK